LESFITDHPEIVPEGQELLVVESPGRGSRFPTVPVNPNPVGYASIPRGDAVPYPIDLSQLPQYKDYPLGRRTRTPSPLRTREFLDPLGNKRLVPEELDPDEPEHDAEVEPMREWEEEFGAGHQGEAAETAEEFDYSRVRRATGYDDDNASEDTLHTYTITVSSPSERSAGPNNEESSSRAGSPTRDTDHENQSQGQNRSTSNSDTRPPTQSSLHLGSFEIIEIDSKSAFKKYELQLRGILLAQHAWGIITGRHIEPVLSPLLETRQLSLFKAGASGDNGVQRRLFSPSASVPDTTGTEGTNEGGSDVFMNENGNLSVGEVPEMEYEKPPRDFKQELKEWNDKRKVALGWVILTMGKKTREEMMVFEEKCGGGVTNPRVLWQWLEGRFGGIDEGGKTVEMEQVEEVDPYKRSLAKIAKFYNQC